MGLTDSRALLRVLGKPGPTSERQNWIQYLGFDEGCFDEGCKPPQRPKSGGT